LRVARHLQVVLLLLICCASTSLGKRVDPVEAEDQRAPVVCQMPEKVALNPPVPVFETAEKSSVDAMISPFQESNTKVLIKGVVKDHSRRPVQGAYVGISHGAQNRFLTSTSTNTDGYYQTEVEKADEYLVSVTSPSGPERSGIRPRMFLSQKKRVVARGLSEATLNFDLDPAGNLVLYSYDGEGRLVRNKDWNVPVFYTTDDRGLIALSAYHAVQDEYSTSKGSNYDLALPNVLIPPGAKRTINLLWEVPGFGRIMLAADNDGGGYVTENQGELKILILSYELAKTQLRFLNNEFSKCKSEGYSFSPDLISKWQTANDFFLEASNPSLDQPQISSLSDKALNYSLHASELLEMEKAKQNIDRYRKRNLSIRIVDERGAPVKESKVKVRQVVSDFLFGVFVSSSLYRSAVDSGFFNLMTQARVNYLTLHLNWKATEPTQGFYDDKLLAGTRKLAELGFVLKGHAIVWFSPSVLPYYVYKMDFKELNQSVYKHVLDVVTSCKDFVHCWELNEMEITNDVNLSLPQMIEVARTAIRAIRKADPKARINISFTEPYGQHSRGRYGVTNEQPYAYVPFEFIQELLKAGIEFDAIALHMYYGGVYFARDLSAISRVVDWYASFGKPIEISEIEVSSEIFDPGVGYWHEKPSEQLQARWITGLFTVLLGKKSVDRISWWSARDTYAFIEKGGIIDSSNRPKEGYQALKKVIEPLWMNLESSSDSSGIISFSGGPGKYLIEAEGFLQTEITIGNDARTDFSLTLTKPHPLIPAMTSPITTQTMMALILGAVVAVATLAYIMRRKRSR